MLTLDFQYYCSFYGIVIADIELPFRCRHVCRQVKQPKMAHLLVADFTWPYPYPYLTTRQLNVLRHDMMVVMQVGGENEN